MWIAGVSTRAYVLFCLMSCFVLCRICIVLFVLCIVCLYGPPRKRDNLSQGAYPINKFQFQFMARMGGGVEWRMGGDVCGYGWWRRAIGRYAFKYKAPNDWNNLPSSL